jgi:signal transduction histidine kinase
MAERIQTAGGHLEISSQPAQGTQVVLRHPG